MAHFAAVTPSDTVPLPVACSDFYIGAAGNLNVVAQGDTVANAVVLAVPGGVLRLPWPVIQIMATDTTASGIVGLGF